MPAVPALVTLVNGTVADADDVMQNFTTLRDTINTYGVLTDVIPTFTVAPIFSHANGLLTNTISERTAAAGVTIDGVLLKDGGSTVTAPLLAAAGSAAAPSFSFSGDADVGLYRSGADELAVAAGGNQIARFSVGAFTVNYPATLTSTLTVVGALTAQSAFAVTGASTLTGGISGLLRPSSDLGSDLGNATFRWSSIWGNDITLIAGAVVGGTLAVTGAVTGGTYNGQTISAAAALTGSLTIASTLAVTGAVTGGTYNGQTISAAASLTGSLAIAGALTGVTTGAFSSNVTVGGTLGVTGAVTLSSTLSVTGTTAHTGTVTTRHVAVEADSLYDIGTAANRFRDGRFVNLYGTLQTAAQPNITSLGTLTSLTLSGALTGVTTGAFSSNVSVGGTLGVTGLLTARNITPEADSLYNIGSDLIRVANVYADTLHGAYDAATLTGTVATARIAGSYTGITAVGTLTTLAVSGAVTGGTYNGQTISAAASLTGTLAVAGTATFSSTVLVSNTFTSRFGTDASTTDTHTIFGKTGSPAAGNADYRLVTSNQAQSRLQLQGFDGTTTKQFLEADFGAGAVTFGVGSAGIIRTIESSGQVYIGASGAALGFFTGSGAFTKQSVSGSRGGNAALASLLTALANYGLVTDSTTA